MTSQITQTEEFLPIADMAEWADFWANNGEAIEMPEADALALARNCSLIAGGGAAALFRIGFVD